MRFRKGEGRKKERSRRWKGEKLEDVKEFIHLGYTLRTNGGHRAHTRERIKNVGEVVKQI